MLNSGFLKKKKFLNCKRIYVSINTAKNTFKKWIKKLMDVTCLITWLWNSCLHSTFFEVDFRKFENSHKSFTKLKADLDTTNTFEQLLPMWLLV